MFRFHHDKDGVNDNAHAAKAAGAKPENAGPDFTFVKAVQAEVAQQNAKGESNPLVVFTLSGHKNSFVLGKPNIEKCVALKFFYIGDVLHVFKHELRLIFRDPRFWIPFIIPPIILAASQAIAVSRYGGQIMQGMEGYMMLLLGCLMAPMGAPLAADSFAGERERNSLELLQLSPIAPAKLFWGKLLAVLPFPIAFSMLAEFAFWFSHPEITATVAVASILGALSAVLITSAFSLLLSLRVKTARAATQLSLFVVVPLLLLVQLGHELFLQGVLIPAVILTISIVICALSTFVGMRKFVSL